MSYLLPAPSATSANDSTKVIAVESIKAVATSLSADVTLPAVGSNFSLEVNPPNLGTGQQGFEVGDRLILTEPINGFSNLNAVVEVASQSGITITVAQIAGLGNALEGSIFPVDTEITGQTRLPNIPTNALRALVSVALPIEAEAAAFDSGHELHLVAASLYQGQAIASAGYRLPTNSDIDLLLRNGYLLRSSGSMELANRDDIESFRIVSRCPLPFNPHIEVTYFGGL